LAAGPAIAANQPEIRGAPSLNPLLDSRVGDHDPPPAGPTSAGQPLNSSYYLL
jgi:hypothetical protein